MKIHRNFPELNKTGNNIKKQDIKGTGGEVKDNFTFDGPKERDEFLKALINLRATAEGSVIKALVMPVPSQVNQARNETPVVLIHGTMVEKDKIEDYNDAALNLGHPVDLTTYLTVKDGAPIQESSHTVSQNINNARMKTAQKHMDEISKIGNDQQKLKEYFGMDSDLYGTRDETSDKVFTLIPGVLDKMDKLLKMDEKELLESFSSRTKEIEKELANDIKKAGFGDVRSGSDLICKKVAGEILDTISPKATLIGHSAGGFVSYNIALNPKEKMHDGNEFSYDGGNGVSKVIILGSPVGTGMPTPLPEGLADWSFDLVDRHVLKPLEEAPAAALAFAMNPVLGWMYGMNKAIMKANMNTSAKMTTNMMLPFINKDKPGYEQVSEGSDFVNTYIKGKEVPDDITVVSVFTDLDGLAAPDTARLDDSKPNIFNLNAEVTVTEEDLKASPKYSKRILAHGKMSEYPLEHRQEFKDEVFSNPQHITRMLNPKNYDGVRWECLQNLSEMYEKDPSLFEQKEFKPVLKKVRDVAAEKLPFNDSPSYVAHKILERLHN